jgi:tetraacyldisaccharide 4'-kinase
MPCDAAQTGDEAQIYLRSGIVPVGISSNRFAAGERLEREFGPSVFLLDDGFQHWKLKRNIDVVLIDVLDPFSSGVFPAGRLREPERALARADAFVLTRTELCRRYDGIVHRIRRWNPSAPIFFCRLVPGQWKTLDGKFAGLPERGRAGAFCGLANPSSFWRSLETAGVNPVWRRAFPDHHRYSAGEIAEMLTQSDYLLTTQKDTFNLPSETRRPIYWLDIDVLLTEESALIEFIRECIVR